MSRAMEHEHACPKNPKDISHPIVRRSAELMEATSAGEHALQGVLTGVYILLAEHTLSTPVTMDSLLGLRTAFRTSQAKAHISMCVPPLDASVLKMKTRILPLAPHLQRDTHLVAHVLISMESFLASLSLLGGPDDWTRHCPSFPVLFCDTILRQDPYRDKHDIGIARLIMEHIDTYHETISHEVNIEIGSAYINNPLPELGEEPCRCPLQRLNVLNILRNHPDALAETAFMHFIEVEKFNAAQGLVDPLAAAKYFHSFELCISELVALPGGSPTNGAMAQRGYAQFALPRASRLQGRYTNVTRSRL